MLANYPIRFSAQLRQHLRALRKKHGLTQAQVGELIGVSQARIAEIEANPGLVSFEQMLQLLSALGVTLSLQEEPAASPALERLKATKPVGKKGQRRQKTSSFAAAYSFNLPAGEWNAYRLYQGNNPGQKSVFVSPVVDQAGVRTPDSPGMNAEQAPDYSRYETATPHEPRTPNPDPGALPTSRRNYVIRQKKGSW